jgi:hypothetical protein
MQAWESGLLRSPAGASSLATSFFLRGSANKRQDYVTVVGHFPVEKPDNSEEQPAL